MDTSILFFAASTLLAIFVLKWLFSRKNFPPGPIGLPIVGYVPFLSKNPHLDFQRLAKKYGAVFRLRFGSANVVVLNDFESTKESFNKDEFGGRSPDLPIEVNQETIDTEAITGLPWKEQRRFSLHMLKDLGLGKSKMEVHIQEEIHTLLEMIEKNVGKPFAAYDLLASSMSNNIGSLVFGKRYSYDDPIRKMLTRSVKDIATSGGQAAWQLFFPWLRRICVFFGLLDVSKASQAQKPLRHYIKKEIAEHEETLNTSDIRDYIDGYLLEIKKRNDPLFSSPILQDMVTGFFLAGSETVRNTIDWLLLSVASNQQVQRRVQQEIDTVIGEHNLPVWTHQKTMPYTEAVIMEVNRWRTVLPLNILRYALADGTVKGYDIPKGSFIISNLWAVHHNPEYWGPDVEEFKPERFLTEDGKHLRKREHYIPFSIGKRACPGEPFAKIESFLYFTSILQKFSIKLPDGKTADFEGELGIGLMAKPQELVFSNRH